MIEERIQQQLREKYNPDGSVLRNMQLQLLDILKEFDAICQKHHIPYWLDSGTLIGAVRHGGFVPWDDDVDVCVLKKDQKRIRQIMQQELGASLKYMDEKVDSTYPRKWARIVKTMDEGDAKSNIIWLDVFIMEHGNRTLYDVVNKTYGKCYRRKTGEIKERHWMRILTFCIYPVSWLFMQCVRYYGRCFCKDSLIFDYGGVFTSIRMTDEVFPLAQIQFEGLSFNAPRHWDIYLRRIYKDYTELPPEASRLAHGVITEIK